MGRIDEALRRAGAKSANEAGANSDVFVSPWSFSEAGTPHEAPAGGERLFANPTAGPDAAHAAQTPPNAGAPLRAASETLAVFRGFHRDSADRLVVSSAATPFMAEQYRRLAATLHHAQLAQGTRVLIVTSARAADGKSLTSTNLALTLSESYRRNVLLIDADLRRPSLHHVFQVPNVTGLGPSLSAKTERSLSVIKVTDTLTLLPAGPPDPDPMGGLSSPRMRQIVDEAAARFDWVIIDTAPVGLLADAKMLAEMSDGVLLVIRAGETRHSAVTRAIDALGRDRIFGIVLNGADVSSADLASYRYYSDAKRTET